MKLSLAEALPLKKQVSKVLQEKLRERSNIAYVEFDQSDKEKGVKVEEPTKSFDEVTAELDEIRNDYRKIDFLLDRANIESTLEWEGLELSIKEAIEVAKQMRGEVAELMRFSNAKKVEKVISYHQTTPTYRKALFNPDALADTRLRMEKKANKLSMLIEKTNHKYEIEFSEASKYL